MLTRFVTSSGSSSRSRSRSMRVLSGFPGQELERLAVAVGALADHAVRDERRR